MHGHRLDAEAVAGAQDAQGDFAAVGDEDFFEHGHGAGRQPITNSGWSNSTG
jgi:hypothetical protein